MICSKKLWRKRLRSKLLGIFVQIPKLSIPDRHLGLRTALEQGSTDLYVKLGQAAAETIDLDMIAADSPILVTCSVNQRC